MNVCPICEKDDKSEKLASIVDSGKDEISISSEQYVPDNIGEYRYTTKKTVTTSGTQMTDLARKLAPPTQPSPLDFGSVAVMGILMFLCWAVISLAASKFIRNQGTESLVRTLGCAIPLILLIISIIWVTLDQRKYAAAKPRWNSASQIWNRLYYCHRDAIIYDPGTGESFETSALNQYIFSK